MTYQARIPISGGGGHIDLRERAGPNPIVTALEKIIERKRQGTQDELARQAHEVEIAYRRKVTELMGQPKPMSEIERELAETQIAYRRKMTELMGQPKPLSAIEQQLAEAELAHRQKATALMGQREPKEPSPPPEPKPGRIVVGADGKTYLVNPVTGEKRDLGIPGPTGAAGGEKITDIINQMSKISGAEEGVPELGLPILDELMGQRRQELMDTAGLEEYEEEVPGTKRTLGWPTLTKPAYRVRPERTETRKGIRKKVGSKEVKRLPKPTEYPNAKWSGEHKMWTITQNGRLMGVK